MSQVQTAEPVRSVTVGNVTVTSTQTPEERFATIAKSMGVPVAEPARATFAGPEGHPHVVVPDGEASTVSKAPPPSPSALEKQNAFDTEMRAKGLQKPVAPPPGQQRPSVPPEQLDTAGIAKLNENYTKLMSQFEALPYSQARDINIEKTRKQFQEEMQEFYQGRKLGEKRSEFRARRDGTAVTPSAPAAPTKAPGWQSHVEEGGWVDLGKLTLDDTSGYTIPRWRADQRVNVQTFDLLKQAKAAGITQAQVNAVLTEQAKAAGWVKA
jgi:hypothetical protein